MSTSGTGVWECSCQLGRKGREEFKFVRDGDMSQVIYPSRTTGEMGIPARGPDNLCTDKRWMLQGAPNETFGLKLQVVDAKVIVTVTSKMTGAENVWESFEGWARHDYCVAGTFNRWRPRPMVMDESMPGVFRLRVDVCNKSDGQVAESFRVLVDADEQASMYPETDQVQSGISIVCGPDADAKGRNWTVRSYEVRKAFEIVLNLTTQDRRKIVTWRWVD